jgi:hypothetical protein
MKKRSKYRPRPILQSPLDFVLSGLKPVRDLPGIYLNAQLKNRTALEQLRKGAAVKEDIDMLIGAFNITEALAIMTAKQWELLKLVMDLHEEQLAQATVYDIEKAHDYVLRIIRMGKARAIVQIQKETT